MAKQAEALWLVSPMIQGYKKRIIPLKGYDYNTREEVGHACKDLVLQGGATKTDVIHLKVKMIADWHLAKGC